MIVKSESEGEKVVSFQSRTLVTTVICLLVGACSNGIAQDDVATKNPERGIKFVKELKADHWAYELHRITITGKVTDHDHQPIRGATLILGLSDPNRFAGKDDTGKEYVFDGEIARTQSDETGVYQFGDVLVPMRKGMRVGRGNPLHAPLQVCAFAAGKGVAWRPAFQYRPTTKQKTLKDEENVRFADELIQFDLTLHDAIALHGKVVTRQGKPIVDAIVRLGQVNDVRDAYDKKPIQSRYSSSDDGRLRPAILPKRFLETRSGEDGSYSFSNVPQNSSIDLSITHPDLPSHARITVNTLGLDIATQPARVREPKNRVGLDGLFDIELQAIRTVTVRAIADDTKEPLPGVRFEAMPSVREIYARDSIAISDDQGVAKIKLLPGQIALKVLPDSWSGIQQNYTSHQSRRACERIKQSTFYYPLQEKFG